jgi:hypothetical protein
MALYYGNDAYVNGVDSITSWSATESVETQPYSSSNVAGATYEPAGIVKWAGAMSGVGAEPAFLADFFAGDTFAFLGVIDNTGGGIKDLAGTAVISSVTIDINAQTAADITWSAEFSINGVMTQGTTGGAQSSIVVVENGKDLSLGLAASGNPTAMTDICIQSAQIVFRKPLIEQICGGSPTYKAGNLECEVSWVVNTTTTNSAHFAANNLRIAEIAVSPSTAWYFEWLRMVGKSNILLQYGSPVSYTVNSKWTAANGTTLGSIIGPSTTQYFGA